MQILGWKVAFSSSSVPVYCLTAESDTVGTAQNEQRTAVSRCSIVSGHSHSCHTAYASLYDENLLALWRGLWTSRPQVTIVAGSADCISKVLRDTKASSPHTTTSSLSKSKKEIGSCDFRKEVSGIWITS